MMVTTNAAANVVGNSFLGNSVVNYGDFGGAVFHDYCRTGRKSTFKSNRFVNNVSQGFGGAMKVRLTLMRLCGLQIPSGVSATT